MNDSERDASLFDTLCAWKRTFFAYLCDLKQNNDTKRSSHRILTFILRIEAQI